MLLARCARMTFCLDSSQSPPQLKDTTPFTFPHRDRRSRQHSATAFSCHFKGEVFLTKFLPQRPYRPIIARSLPLRPFPPPSTALKSPCCALFRSIWTRTGSSVFSWVLRAFQAIYRPLAINTWVWNMPMLHWAGWHWPIVYLRSHTFMTFFGVSAIVLMKWCVVCKQGAISHALLEAAGNVQSFGTPHHRNRKQPLKAVNP